jgi:hypothetical protein
MGSVLDFLFGKKPQIFDKDGKVRHELPKSKWDAWNGRYQQGSEYNWHNHSGMKAHQEPPPNRPKTQS